MEDVLRIYHRPYDSAHPVICMDELSKQLTQEIRVPQQTAPGRIKRIDHEYKRNGTANVFMLYEPLQGWRNVSITERRTKQDWAHLMRDLVDIHYPDAVQITLVCDNLNTHAKSSLYEAFLPEEAERIAMRLDIHYTPKHGSWLNVAECELSHLSRQCLGRRLPDMATIIREVNAWTRERNNDPRPVDWQFTVDNARTKLKRLYPSFQQS